MATINNKQLDYLNWEFGVFFHFGIRTFYENHLDWDMQDMPLDVFNPTELDCEQWIKTIKEAGARYAVFVCKHCDGFANWPSKYTEYNVANTPYGKDIVKQYVDACRKYGVKVGLYYSPAEFGTSKKGNKEYDDYFINQIAELLLNYGKIDYLWFDGCGSENHEYDSQRIIGEIRRMQPEILIFNMWDPDTKWVGNEAGLANSPNNLVSSSTDFSINTNVEDLLDEPQFLPSECDCRIRLLNWFYSEKDEDTVKSVDELMGLYSYSVGRSANFLINIGPDRRGLLPEKDVKALLDFGKELKRRYSTPIKANISQTDNIATLEFETHLLLNHLIIQEAIKADTAVENFKVNIYPYPYGKPITVYYGTTIGHKVICMFPTVRTSRVEIILDKNQEVLAKAYYII